MADRDWADHVMRIWREHGGSTYGPNVEHANIELAKFWGAIEAITDERARQARAEGRRDDCQCDTLMAAISDHREVLRKVEAVLSIVEPRSDKREYLATLFEVRDILAKPWSRALAQQDALAKPQGE